jgi:predicted ATPase/DNA-binding NarL/FixJ family response regulator
MLLPPYPNLFVGRDQELDEITQLLTNPHCRLLTLVGPGGSGKTRLALEAVRRMDFPDGVHFVPLQPLSAPDLIVPTIAEVLRFQFYPGGEPKDQLLNYLHDKCLLLLIDNFEHVMDGADFIHDLLAHAPQIKLCATSRERLNLLEEWVLDVGGLSYPSSEGEREIETYSAVKLFVQQAQRVQVGFTLTDKHAISRICQLVRGMPLALELAASWVRALSCAEISAEIERSLDILETRVRNIPSRHRSMRVVLDHSWSLLAEDERAVFQRLSVFKGGFRKEAAQQVAGAPLQMLSSFVDKSLLRVNANGRYDLHELLRQYAEEKLKIDLLEHTLVQNQHSAYFAEFIFQRKTDVTGKRQKEAIKEIEAEIDNVRTALQHSISLSDWQELEKYVWGLRIVYYVMGLLREGQAVFAQAVHVLETLPPDSQKDCVLGQLYASQAFFEVMLGNVKTAKELLNTSLLLLWRLDTPEETAFTLVGKGGLDVYFGDYSEAAAALSEAEKLARKDNFQFMLAWILSHQASLYQAMGRFEEGVRYAQESVIIFRSLGNRLHLANTLQDFGRLMKVLGHYREAKSLILESLTAANEFSSKYLIAHGLSLLGEISHAMHEDAEATRHLYEAMEIAREVGITRLQLDVLMGITEIAAQQVSPAQIVERLALILHHPTSQRETLDRAQQLLEKLAAEFAPDDFEACQERGRTMLLANVLDSVYETSSFALPEGPEPVPLTKRELEILRLIAKGLLNREIADHLILSEGTIKWYVNQILSKLDAANRTQAVTRARSLGLLA